MKKAILKGLIFGASVFAVTSCSPEPEPGIKQLWVDYDGPEANFICYWKFEDLTRPIDWYNPEEKNVSLTYSFSITI